MMTHILTIPRTVFDSALTQMTDNLNQSKEQIEMVFGEAVVSKMADTLCWTVPSIQPTVPLQKAMLVLALEQGDHLLPMRWVDWYSKFTPHLSLNTHPILFIRISHAGETSAIARHNNRWESVSHCDLPGSGMLQISLKDQPYSPPITSTTNTSHGRYSRIAGALGEAPFQRLQKSLFTIIGAGRTGSSLANSLIRMGASVLTLDTDIVELNSLDGDVFLPSHEGMLKTEALQKSLQALVRPGATLQGRAVDVVTSSITGNLLSWSDVIISAVDSDASRMAVAAWSTALLKPHLDVGIAIDHNHEIGADIRLMLPNQGCLACVGGFSQQSRLPELVAERFALAKTNFDQVEKPDFRLQRSGSLRSMNQIATHLGIRLIEQLYTGKFATSRYLRLEDKTQFSIRELNAVQKNSTCPICHSFLGQGRQALDEDEIRLLALRLSGRIRKIG